MMNPMTELQEKRSEVAIDLSTARTLIKGCDHWLLIGNGWRVLKSIAIVPPEFDHPIQVIDVPGFSKDLLLNLFDSPHHFIDIKSVCSGNQ
jgi:hypothetical protein